MSLHDRLLQIVTALPSDGAAVTLTRADLLALLEGEGQGELHPENGRDLTVSEVAEEMGRSPSTVRGWLIAGDLRGFKLNNRDWRVPRSALREYLDAQAAEPEDQDEQRDPVDISAWRRVAP